MTHDHLALTKRWFEEVWNQKKTQTIRELVAPDCIWHGTSETGEDLRGAEGFLLLYTRLVDAFPDMHFDVKDLFGVGDQIAVRWTATMHHSGNGLGMEASGADITIQGMGIARFSDGKLVETWDNWDKLGLFQQIEAARTKRAGA
jgi:steroid delta-isomerase-like uncharacterized protein